MGIKVERYAMGEVDGRVIDEYPEATTAKVDDDSKALTVIVEDVFLDDKQFYPEDLAIAGYPEGGWTRWYFTEVPKYETEKDRKAKEENTGE